MVNVMNEAGNFYSLFQTPYQRRLYKGLLLKFKFSILCTILLGVILREYGIYELSRG